MSSSVQDVREARPGRRPVRHLVTRLAERVTTPLLPADYLDLFNPLRADADLRGRIEEVVHETADAATLVIRPGADWAGHVPGQYVRIGVDVDGVRQWRAYSLTHGPRDDGRISITVKAVPDGKVSNHLVRRAVPGTLVHLEQAAGEFVLPTGPDELPAKLLFVTAGSGITPVIGMLRNLFPVTDEGVARLPRSAGYDITVVHVAPSEPDSIFIANLRALDEAGLIDLVARYDDEHGVLDVARLGELVPDLHDRTTFACGPAGLLDALEAHHAEGICYGCVLPMRQGAVRDLRTGEITTAVPGDGVRIQTCINAAAGACELDH
jgi:ferredoxin-NADP reductase